MAFFFKKKNRKSEVKCSQSTSSVVEHTHVTISSGEEKNRTKTAMIFTLGIWTKIGDYKVKYNYKDVLCKLSPQYAYDVLGKKIEINEFGDILYSGNIIGKVGPGKILEMIGDWLKRGEPFKAG